jgi:signal transduction histidine kinase
MGRSLYVKLLLAIMAAYAVVAAGSLVADYRVQATDLHQQLITRAINSADILASGSEDPLARNDSVALENLVDLLNSERGLDYAAVIDAGGTVVASTRPAEVGKHMYSAILVSSDRSHTLPNGDVEAIAPVFPVQLNHYLGWVRVRVSNTSVNAALTHALLVDGIIRLIGVILFALLALWLARSILQPLKQLVRAAQRIRRGDYDERVSVSTHDEIGMLATVFNDMIDTLSRRIRHLTFLAEAGMKLASMPHSDADAIQSLIDELNTVLEMDGIAVYKHSASTWTLEVATGLTPAALDCIVNVLGVLSNPESHVRAIADVTTDPLLRPLHLDRAGLASLLIVWIGPAESYALISVSRQARSYEHEERGVALNFASQLAIARENERLFASQQEAIQAKDQFLSIVSHELRTPLTAIKGYADLLLQRDQHPTIHRFAKVIARQALRLNSMVDELLDVTRIDHDRFTLNRQLVSSQQLISEVVQNFRLLEPNRTINLELDPDLPEVAWDRNRIEQVLSNLIDNALKYSDGPVTVNAHCIGTAIWLSVSDQGPGIPPEEQAHLFERFYSGSKRTRQSGGLGIGLYVVQRIVEEHGGQVTIKSKPGQGSRFTVILPMATPKLTRVE